MRKREVYTSGLCPVCVDDPLIVLQVDGEPISFCTNCERVQPGDSGKPYGHELKDVAPEGAYLAGDRIAKRADELGVSIVEQPVSLLLLAEHFRFRFPSEPKLERANEHAELRFIPPEWPRAAERGGWLLSAVKGNLALELGEPEDRRQAAAYYYWAAEVSNLTYGTRAADYNRGRARAMLGGQEFPEPLVTWGLMRARPLRYERGYASAGRCPVCVDSGALLVFESSGAPFMFCPMCELAWAEMPAFEQNRYSSVEDLVGTQRVEYPTETVLEALENRGLPIVRLGTDPAWSGVY